MPEPREHAANRNMLERILRQIPGFRGYLEKEYRRDSDALQREWLSDRLQRSKSGLDELARGLTEAGQLDELPAVERLRGRIDKLSARIRGAMRGYSGIFDLVRIDESVLDRVYEYDAALVDQVDEFGSMVEALATRPDDANTAIRDLLDRVEAFQRVWDDREDLLKGLD